MALAKAFADILDNLWILVVIMVIAVAITTHSDRTPMKQDEIRKIVREELGKQKK